jgi:hypothetical protein
MAVSFRAGVTVAAGSGDPETLNPGSDPASGDILIIGVAQSSTGANSAATLGSDGFGGTWTSEHSQVWGSRRWLDVWVNDDWTTASGTVAVDYTMNQDRARVLMIVEGAETYTEDASAGDTSGSDWTPTLTAGHDGHIVMVQVENEVTVSTPTDWTKVGEVNASAGLRTFAVFTIVGEPPDLTPTFSFGGAAGFTGWSAYFDAGAGPPPDAPVLRGLVRSALRLA